MQDVSEEESWGGGDLKYIQKAATRKKYHCRKRPCPDGFFESFCDFSASTNSSPTIMACTSFSCSVTEASGLLPHTCSAPQASKPFHNSPLARLTHHINLCCKDNSHGALLWLLFACL